MEPGKSILYRAERTTREKYSNIGGRLYEGTRTRWPSSKPSSPGDGVNRVMRYAFELARNRNKHLTSATKSNGIIHNHAILG